MSAPPLYTLFLRLEGPLQAWGDNSKFVIRRTMEAATKSGVLGLICRASGWTRQESWKHLKELNKLRMAVRIDRPGTRWWDYHTVGAGIGMMTAAGEPKTGAPGTLVTRREYMADASFLVALQGGSALIQNVKSALENPKWPAYLGRKSCPPSVPILARPRENETWTDPSIHPDLARALGAVPWRPRLENETPPENELDCLIEWRASDAEPTAPQDAEVWYDSPKSFDPPVHEARLVQRLSVEVNVVGHPLQQPTPPATRVRTDYDKSTWGKLSDMRRRLDQDLCVFCKSPATTVQHVNYRQAGKEDNLAALADPQLAQDRMRNLRSLCRLCHDAVTMIEYGLGMGLDRINPEEPRWRDRITEKRNEIIQFRSLQTRRRRLEVGEVE